MSVSINDIEAGDLVENVSDEDSDLTVGKRYRVDGISGSGFLYLKDDGDDSRSRPPGCYKRVDERLLVVKMVVLSEVTSRREAVNVACERALGTNETFVIVDPATLEAYKGITSVEKAEL